MEKSNKEILNKVWDYIIVGTGMGAGPIGLKLAQAGNSVLFLEKGLSQQSTNALKGQFAELFMGKKTTTSERTQILKRAGRLSESIYDTTGKIKNLLPFTGSGVGGSSALYGMVLERFHESDFSQWPLEYSEFSKFYDQAEKLFRVRKPSEYKHPANKALNDYFASQGLHPYPLPTANEENGKCQTCQSYVCEHNCKNDSNKICIQPAINLWGAALITDCKVEQVLMNGSKASGVTCTISGTSIEIKAKNVILSAGALETPRLLMRSKSINWSQGIGNNFGNVGRYLMRHLVDLYTLKVDNQPNNPHAKEIGVGDFYTQNGQKYGVVQSFGRLPPTNVILQQMKQTCEDNFGSLMGNIIQFFFPLLKIVLNFISARRLVLCTVLEDQPRFENRVWDENDKLNIHYQISEEDNKKVQWMRKTMNNLLRPFKPMLIAASEKNEMLAHACGTCRMGTDSKLSVVNTENRIHGTENVYVVDASFFPTSGGTNPALTIAANSLRVAEILIAKSKSKTKVSSKTEKTAVLNTLE